MGGGGQPGRMKIPMEHETFLGEVEANPGAEEANPGTADAMEDRL